MGSRPVDSGVRLREASDRLLTGDHRLRPRLRRPSGTGYRGAHGTVIASDALTVAPPARVLLISIVRDGCDPRRGKHHEAVKKPAETGAQPQTTSLRLVIRLRKKR
ncbi:hypothetical protein [Streptosporangium sp. NPDC049376]|uniref:hypothetical protein n=1 Tax=Streptosporangium sp. NPDC049376 TaxID=3366192 RepID=UPI0037BBC0E7